MKYECHSSTHAMIASTERRGNYWSRGRTYNDFRSQVWRHFRAARGAVRRCHVAQPVGLFLCVCKNRQLGTFLRIHSYNWGLSRSSRFLGCTGRQNRIFRTQINEDGMIQTTLIICKSYPHYIDTDVPIRSTQMHTPPWGTFVYVCFLPYSNKWWRHESYIIRLTL